ncbi:MAG: GGDEF domain-containing protein [Rhodospirillum sp.]|nr:GGDEF domain-containing protein [Rhodospirillum sp.]MCF8491847.1 GGDEF domain-containing protein [Rhodospirillum sp.]MCF8501152.1 GGDEF domain-containing protein [Rhodospirillum sp.]
MNDFLLILGFGATLGAILIWYPASRWRRRQVDRLTESLKSTQDVAIKLAVMDPLTGLFNRRRVFESLLVEHERAKRDHLPYSVVMVKPLDFHKVTDAHGQTLGDSLLRDIGKMCQSEARATDIVGRWKGVTFVILCPEADEGAVRVLAGRLRKRVEDTNFTDVGRLKLAVGMSVSDPDHPDTADAALTRAETALRRVG